MPTLPLHLTPSNPSDPHDNTLPQLLHTPSGLALLEIQGTINLPPSSLSNPTEIGNLIFPSDPETNNKVWLYIGKHQRMTGELKKLVTPLGVLRRRVREDIEMTDCNKEKWDGEELEITEIIRWKIIFSGRPEPVGNTPVKEDGVL